jgi:hypothetical protein
MTTATTLLLLFVMASDAAGADVGVDDDDVVFVAVDAGGCVDEDAFVDGVSARVAPGSVAPALTSGGVEAGDRRDVGVTFVEVEGHIEVRVTLDVKGQRVGARRLGPFRSCEAATDAAVLAVTLVVDPLGPLPPTPTPPTTPTPTPTTPTTTPTTLETVVVQAPSVVSPWSVALSAGGGVGSGFGVVPGPMGLVRLRLDPGVVPVVVAMGGRLDVPGPLVVDGKRQVESVGGAFFVEGCFGAKAPADVVVDLCGLGQAGGLRALGVGIDNAVSATPRLIGVGAAVVVRVPLWTGLGVFARFAVDAPVLRARLFADGEVLWESPPFTGQVAVGLDGLVSGGR